MQSKVHPPKIDWVMQSGNGSWWEKKSHYFPSFSFGSCPAGDVPGHVLAWLPLAVKWLKAHLDVSDGWRIVWREIFHVIELRTLFFREIMATFSVLFVGLLPQQLSLERFVHFNFSLETTSLPCRKYISLRLGKSCKFLRNDNSSFCKTARRNHCSMLMSSIF